MLNPKHFKKIIVQAKILTEDKVKELEKEAQRQQQGLEDYLLSQKLVAEDSLY